MERALSFSNQCGTKKSSLGVFRTAETYQGQHGYSLRLDGLEQGINDAARDRTIVVHPAGYVTSDRAQERMIGRSWGCPAVRPAISQQLIDDIKDGSLIWTYFPDDGWLQRSPYLAHAATTARPLPTRLPSPAISATRWGFLLLFVGGAFASSKRGAEQLALVRSEHGAYPHAPGAARQAGPWDSTRRVVEPAMTAQSAVVMSGRHRTLRHLGRQYRHDGQVLRRGPVVVCFTHG
jgi:hypothetical protein